MKSLTRLSLAALLCAGMAHAQTASPTPEPKSPATKDSKIPVELAPADNKVEEQELLILSPFEVSGQKDTGYQATETLAGTRIRTQLKDVASSISIVTKEFLADIAATDNSTLLQYTTNTEVAGTRGNFAGTGNGRTLSAGTGIQSNQRVRGLTSADQTRDYFGTDVPWDSYNIERVEIQRGPNAILFGLGSPSGIINTATRNAIYRDTGSVESRMGSYGSNRVSLDMNKSLIDNVLAIRVDGLWNNDKFQQKPAFKDDKRISGALRFDPQFFGKDFATSIKVKAEKGRINANMPRNTPPYDSITPWFDAAGKFTVVGASPANTGYTLYDLASTAVGVSPYLKSIIGQQTPAYFMSGTTGQTYQINGGYINNAFLNTNGTKRGAGQSAVGQGYSEPLYAFGSYRDFQSNNAAEPNVYMRAMYGDKSLTDRTVFDFYNKLIDGDNKGESADWTTYNVSFSQNGWGDRVGLELTADYQKYNNGNWSVFGASPAISIDVTQVMQDNSTNPNYGRPLITSGAGGSGTVGTTERKGSRANLFAEFRSSDFIQNGLWTKILGKHRFNAVASRDTVFSESLNYNMYANNNAWDAYANQTTGYTNGFTNRAPIAVVYLGNSLASRTAASGASIPNASAQINLRPGNIYLFDSTWNSSANPSDPWTPTGAYQNEVYTSVAPGTGTQASNPANYKGWSADRNLNLMSYKDGDPLYTSASKSERVTTSYAGTWQGYMWNESFVPTLGWRYDVVTSKRVSAGQDGANKGFLKMDGGNYMLPDLLPTNYYKTHSVSGGTVFHINKALPKRWDDVMPLNVSLSYNESSNFQVGTARVDMYNRPISNPQGKTTEYGVLLSTKDNRFSLRAIQFKTVAKNSTITNDSGFFGTIQQGLKFRNVFLYQMSGYDLSTRVGYAPTNAPLTALGGTPGVVNGQSVTWGTRWFWTPAYVDDKGRAAQTAYYSLYAGQTLPTNQGALTLQTWSQSIAMRDASMNAWNDIQKWLDAKGFFSIWNMSPTTTSALTDRSTYEASIAGSSNPAANTPANAAYTPATSSVAAYGGGAPGGYTVTGDQESKGHEFELTANITSNWRLAFNASQTTAINKNIGGEALQEFVDYMDVMIAGPAGEMRQFNGDYQSGNSLRKKWADWRTTWTWQKLQEKTTAAELRKWHFSVVSNYSFTKGWLKGVGVGGAYRWADKIVTGYPVYLDAQGYAQYDLSKPAYGPADESGDLWTSYEHKLTNKINWKIQLNIRNVLKNEGLIPVTVQPDGQSWAGARIKPVQEWSLTNTFMF